MASCKHRSQEILFKMQTNKTHFEGLAKGWLKMEWEHIILLNQPSIFEPDPEWNKTNKSWSILLESHSPPGFKMQNPSALEQAAINST